MVMKERILNDLKEAMKQKDKELLSVIRMVKGAIQMDEIAKKRELNDDEVIAIISKQIKTRKESIAEFEKAGRDDLKNQTQSEIDILMRYMPEQMSEEEVLRVIDQAFETVQPTSMKDMGKLMGVITPQVRGKADMGFVNKMIKERLSAK
ncbi:MAG TPA: GatB/YqeY domain-containing protein [Candidatus Fimihabitans intestinipullorum]|uniref:GatB/YqeY domain-containing protein n=1 Tax=Candidatus Fimihabitans intestinipullorum TaxID=2840820 RepID=A0A9D1L494_9BACT|nr:GatB/YqeY domain-containing protein [Candidatus Fimihabitans intestinipullorum]